MSAKPGAGAACQTAHLLTVMATHQGDGHPVTWRASNSRVWLSTGDPKPALQDAAAKFSGILAQNIGTD